MQKKRSMRVIAVVPRVEEISYHESYCDIFIRDNLRWLILIRNLNHGVFLDLSLLSTYHSVQFVPKHAEKEDDSKKRDKASERCPELLLPLDGKLDWLSVDV